MENYDHFILNDYKIGIMEDMNFYENDTFDVILATGVLCSVQNVTKCLKEVHRILKPVKLKNKFFDFKFYLEIKIKFFVSINFSGWNLLFL